MADEVDVEAAVDDQERCPVIARSSGALVCAS